MGRMQVGTSYGSANSEAAVNEWFQQQIDAVARAIWATTKRIPTPLITPQTGGEDVEFGPGPAANMPADVQTILCAQDAAFLWRWETAGSDAVKDAMLVELTAWGPLAERWASPCDVMLELRFTENSPTSFDVSCSTYLMVREAD